MGLVGCFEGSTSIPLDDSFDTFLQEACQARMEAIKLVKEPMKHVKKHLNDSVKACHEDFEKKKSAQFQTGGVLARRSPSAVFRTADGTAEPEAQRSIEPGWSDIS
mmetsp:Transcript_1236/g.1662  ORF Transcript_1236/g.1662 Transcript_1236/m.1662 type:complete len:106 (-) Transcript_1236:855-1172(-)